MAEELIAFWAPIYLLYRVVSNYKTLSRLRSDCSYLAETDSDVVKFNLVNLWEVHKLFISNPKYSLLTLICIGLLAYSDVVPACPFDPYLAIGVFVSATVAEAFLNESVFVTIFEFFNPAHALERAIFFWELERIRH